MERAKFLNILVIANIIQYLKHRMTAFPSQGLQTGKADENSWLMFF